MKWQPSEICLATGETVKPFEAEFHGKVRYLCSGGDCEHFQEQLSLPGAPRSVRCALTEHPPRDLCQPLYLELAEAASRSSKRGADLTSELETALKEEAERKDLASRVRQESLRVTP